MQSLKKHIHDPKRPYGACHIYVVEVLQDNTQQQRDVKPPVYLLQCHATLGQIFRKLSFVIQFRNSVHRLLKNVLTKSEILRNVFKRPDCTLQLSIFCKCFVLPINSSFSSRFQVYMLVPQAGNMKITRFAMSSNAETRRNN